MMNETFDFAYDWELFHHIFPVDRVQYVKNVNSLLNTDAKYLSVLFSEQSLQFGGAGKYRKTVTRSSRRTLKIPLIPTAV